MSNIDSQNGKYHPKGKNNLNVENLEKKILCLEYPLTYDIEH